MFKRILHVTPAIVNSDNTLLSDCGVKTVKINTWNTENVHHELMLIEEKKIVDGRT